jgi:hypothetical protein
MTTFNDSGKARDAEAKAQTFWTIFGGKKILFVGFSVVGGRSREQTKAALSFQSEADES